jgi:hypothetical protein
MRFCTDFLSDNSNEFMQAWNRFSVKNRNIFSLCIGQLEHVARNNIVRRRRSDATFYVVR